MISVAVKALKPKPLIPNRLAVFEQLRRKGKHVFLYAFDLLELDGQDLRRDPLETRNGTLASLAAWEPSGGIRDQGGVGM